jgi:hypothetical protein
METFHMQIYKLSREALGELFHDANLAISQETTLRIAIDEGTLKIKVGEDMWSRPLDLE